MLYQFNGVISSLKYCLHIWVNNERKNTITHILTNYDFHDNQYCVNKFDENGDFTNKTPPHVISYLQWHRTVWVPGMSVYVLYMAWACCCAVMKRVMRGRQESPTVPLADCHASVAWEVHWTEWRQVRANILKWVSHFVGPPKGEEIVKYICRPFGLL